MDKIALLTKKNTIMKEKTKIVREAIAAFTQKYEELPADAGWPVVREWKNDVYFARSLEEWKAYKFGQILMSVLFKAVIAITLGIIVLAVLGHYEAALYSVLAYAVPFSCALLLPKKNGSEIRFYTRYDGKIHRIAT